MVELTIVNADMSSGSNTAYKIHNGNLNDYIHSHVAFQTDQWISVELSSNEYIGYVEIYNRRGCCEDRINPFEVFVGNSFGDMKNAFGKLFCLSFHIQRPPKI